MKIIKHPDGKKYQVYHDNIMYIAKNLDEAIGFARGALRMLSHIHDATKAVPLDTFDLSDDDNDYLSGIHDFSKAKA
tara:strand:+ start:962 stop:1192 length:231 start_codon:yes stop_codon:yes gene_type:complete